MRQLYRILASLVVTASVGSAQPPLAASAAVDRTLDRLLGRWTLRGTVRGDSVTYHGAARRILRDRFVELHLEDAAQPSVYEARIAIGADTVAGRVLAHWLDNFGAAFSVPHGSGRVTGDSLQFTITYSDGPFRDTFVFQGDTTWTLHIESRTKAGRWQTFARYAARRPSGGPGGAVPPVTGTSTDVATLRWIDVAPGTGAPVQPGQCLAVHYTGWLTDGTRFSTTRDSTADGRPRPPLVFPQGTRRVIAGWDAGFEGMRVGGRRRLIIPYPFAYGERGRPPGIPPRATLTFDVEVMGAADTLPVRDGDGRYPGCAPWTDAPGPVPPTTWREITGPGVAGRVLRVSDWAVPGLKPRHVDVWLPPGYDADRSARYPVLYMHDGQNVFDPASGYGGQEWGVDEVITAMTQDGRLRLAIVVALWNTADRWREYLPQQAVTGMTRVGTGIGGRVDVTEPWLGDAYLAFLVETVKPAIDRTFRTRPERAQTFIMGSSMGGLASLYAISRYPEVFGGAAAISTHWPAADGATISWFADRLPDRATHRIWMDHGTATLDSLYPPLQARMDAAFRRAGWTPGTQWVTRAYPGAAHDERSWRARLHEPLAFLLGSASPPLAASDSALIGRVLLAEDRRAPDDPAITEGLAHPDVRIQRLARRARGRIADPVFGVRDSLPPAAPATWWPEPAWRLRFRALRPPKGECAPLRAALADSAWAVRLRAMDLADSTCARDDALVAALEQAVEALPADASRRTTGDVSWHAAAHAIVALARVRPASAALRLARVSRHRQWQVRAYAARAAAVLGDTAVLRALAQDREDNVAEVAIERLAARTGHADDARYLQAITRDGAQVVRAAATALAGSPDPRVPAAASAAFTRWVAKQHASARDARLALLKAAGRPATDDQAPPVTVTLPPRAVALALGEDVRLRVTMADASGGGSFTVKLRGDVAPMMAARLLALAQAGYYDGLTWHRVEPDFVIQGGSPGANEYVGLASFLRDELGTIPHPRGTVGMSTRGHDTGDAQWFVNLRDNRRLMRDYTVFGEVTDGIGVVDGVLEGDIIARIRVLPPGSP